MNSSLTLPSAIVAISLICALSCSVSPQKKSSHPESSVALNPGDGSHYVTLEFNPGKTTLSEKSRLHLKELADIAEKSRKKIDDIKVLAWADKEYPNKVRNASTEEIILAKNRARSIRNFLQEELKYKIDIDSFNMARRPNIVSRIFETEEYKVKDDFEKSGTTALRADNGQLSYTKASKAIVILDYKDIK